MGDVSESHVEGILAAPGGPLYQRAEKEWGSSVDQMSYKRAREA